MSLINPLFKKGLYTIIVCLSLGYSVNAQSLEALIQLGIKNSPELAKFNLQHQMASEKVNEVNTIPNTEIGIGYFVSSPETRTGPQVFKASVKQMMPWFGSVTAREHYTTSVADAEYQEIAIAQRKLLSTISQSYFNMWGIGAKQNVLTEQIALLKTIENLALTSVEVGSASVVDVLKIQMRQNDIVQLQAILQQDYLAEQSQLNLLLNRSKSDTIVINDNLKMPKADDLIPTEVTQLHPELLQYDKLYASVEQSELLNQKERAPMIGFGLDYITVAERADMDVANNGKDIIMPMLSLSIPIFNSSYKSKTKQNNLKMEVLNMTKIEKKNTLETVLDKAIKNRNSARIRFETQSKNLEQAKNAEAILMANYETGTIDFNDVLDIQDLQLKFEINQIEAITNYYKQQNIIKYLSK